MYSVSYVIGNVERTTTLDTTDPKSVAKFNSWRTVIEEELQAMGLSTTGYVLTFKCIGPDACNQCCNERGPFFTTKSLDASDKATYRICRDCYDPHDILEKVQRFLQTEALKRDKSGTSSSAVVRYLQDKIMQHAVCGEPLEG